MSEPGVWFHWYSNGGRFKSWPVNGKGWAAIVGLVAVTVGGMVANQMLVEDRSLRFAFHFLGLIAAGGLAVVLTFVRGKRVSSLPPKIGWPQ